jgi:hypothetical protein
VLTLRVCSLGIILGPVLLRMYAAFQVNTKVSIVVRRLACKATNFLQNFAAKINPPTFAGESRTELEIPLTICE